MKLMKLPFLAALAAIAFTLTSAAHAQQTQTTTPSPQPQPTPTLQTVTGGAGVVISGQSGDTTTGSFAAGFGNGAFTASDPSAADGHAASAAAGAGDQKVGTNTASSKSTAVISTLAEADGTTTTVKLGGAAQQGDWAKFGQCNRRGHERCKLDSEYDGNIKRLHYVQHSGFRSDTRGVVQRFRKWSCKRAICGRRSEQPIVRRGKQHGVCGIHCYESHWRPDYRVSRDLRKYQRQDLTERQCFSIIGHHGFSAS
jgi:hypothetical protein